MNTQSRISVLIVDSDSEFAGKISRHLADAGLFVRSAHNTKTMQKYLHMEEIDVVVIDLIRPLGEGLVMCRQIRKANGPRVIILSAMSGDIERIVGLESGADDYIAKPCNLDELLARIRAVLRAKGPLKKHAAVASRRGAQ